MSRRSIQVGGVLVVVAMMMVGCGGPKEPPMVEPPEEPVATQPTQQVETPAEMPMEDDGQPDWESGELGVLNQFARDNGLLGDVYFAYDRSDLSQEATDRLAANAAFMRDHPNLTFTIEGHCDERGTNGYNLALGDRRASTASSYLGSLGVDGGRLSSVSYGEERPQCMTSAESCWSRNRRAHFVITGRR